MVKILVSVAITGVFVLGLMLSQVFAQPDGGKANASGCEGKGRAPAGYCPGKGLGDPNHDHSGPPGKP